jgi:hypothetical protein
MQSTDHLERSQPCRGVRLMTMMIIAFERSEAVVGNFCRHHHNIYCRGLYLLIVMYNA